MGHCLSGSSLAAALACGEVVVAVTAVFLTVTVVLGRYFGDLLTLAWLGVEERLNAKLGSLRVLCLGTYKVDKKIEWWEGDLKILLVFGSLPYPAVPEGERKLLHYWINTP